MTNKTVWFVTGAGRGMGVDIVKAALAAGHAVVATGRNTEAATKALGSASLFGPVNVTRAVLPVLRAQRSGLIVTISSTGDIAGQAFVSAYSAAKFGVEGWMESLAPEIAPFGIRTMLVQGGDPAKLARALVQLAGQAEPPRRWPAGADAVETFEKKARELLDQAGAHRTLSSSLAHDDAGK